MTTVVQRIATLLRAEGHDATVVAPRYPYPTRGESRRDPDPDELRIPSVALPVYPDIRLALPHFRDIARFFDAARPDVVHVHTEGALGLAGRRYALQRQLPLVTTFHTNFPQYSRHYGVGLLEPLVWRWLQWFHRPAQLTFTPGEGVRDELVRRGIGRAAVWGRGVDTQFFHPARRDASWRRWLAGGENTPIVLHVGRLAREKNLDVLIDAWLLAHETLGERALFVVAGEGPLARRIEARLPFVRLLGFLPRHDLAKIYASADLCVFPSHTETCGLVALEAMASGIPVIAADAGGFRESVRSGVSGMLVAPHDPRAYADAVTTLIQDAPQRLAFGAAAREHVLTRDVARENVELLELYSALAGLTERRTSPCAA
ncbi:MAG TPA: glycosyltransferase family 1 protein [Gemmatimonadales bacterium]|nr:glycosyltransferase family 1 protein [Gemmatimonadales bacterium]